MRILILEDDGANAELIQFYLEEAGHTSLITTKASQLFACLDVFRPDLITIDIGLPDMDGLTVMHQLHHNPSTQHIPIIFITIMEEQRSQSLSLGASGFLVKPFTQSELIQAIRNT